MPTARPHPNLNTWLAEIERLSARRKARGEPVTPATLREAFTMLTRTFVTAGPAIARALDARLGGPTAGFAVRLYDPEPAATKPVCIYLHGGGHMVGDIEVYDPICRRLAQASGWLIVAPDYRLAPEHPYPAGLEDCQALVRQVWTLLHQQGLRGARPLCLAGDSAGGALTATLSALGQHDPSLRVDGQILIYPSLDYCMAGASIERNGRGYFLEQHRIAWYFDHYFQRGEDRRAASPLHMPITGALPPTLLLTAGFCPLHDEALAYRKKLEAAGVPCEQLDFPDMIHAYLNLEKLVPVACARSYARMGAFLRARAAAAPRRA